MPTGRMPAPTTIVIDGPRVTGEAGPDGRQRLVTDPIDPGQTFDDAIPSWNVRGDFRALIRVRRCASGAWSDWHSIGSWGDAPPAPRIHDGVNVDIDRLRAAEPLSAVQLAFDSLNLVSVDRVSVCVGTGRVHDAPPTSLTAVRLDVPARSQHDAPENIARRICSPTCVAMVLAYFGIDVPTERVADACFDAEHDVYGNWNRAIQTAYSFGVSGSVQRFATWEAPSALLHAGRPIVASIAFESGALPGAPLPRTDGHLVVIRGVDGDAILVNDPAAPRDAVSTRYPLDALGRAWFGHGGVAYVLDGKRPGPPL